MSQPSRYPVSNIEYNIIVTMSNLLQGSETLQKYRSDAEQAGDAETAAIFGRIRDSYDSQATELHEALKRVVSQS